MVILFRKNGNTNTLKEPFYFRRKELILSN